MVFYSPGKYQNVIDEYDAIAVVDMQRRSAISCINLLGIFAALNGITNYLYSASGPIKVVFSIVSEW